MTFPYSTGNVHDSDSIFEDVFVYGDTYAQSFNNVEISVVGSTLTFTVAGIGSTSLTLS